MRKLALLFFLAITALPAIAAKRVTVEQLEQAVAAAQGKPDAEVAQQLSELQLTERLSGARFARLKAELPGETAEQALVALADSSEFLNLPAADIPPTAPPNPAAQRQMMALVVNYVTKTIHQLPNFFATRNTTRFEDRPQADWYAFQPLHLVGKSSKSVIYREGQEVVDTGTGRVKKTDPGEAGLVSWGEFGPILSTVLLDAAQSKLAWSHWEQGAGGPEAVFGYQVPSPKSNYQVQFCCASDDLLNLETHVVRERVGYHGEMTIDPAHGTILRLTVEAELPLGEKLTQAKIMVEYEAVDIGGMSFICPTRSVAFSLMRYAHQTTGAHSALDQDPIKKFVNDVAFGQYHRLGSETRILTDASEESPGNPAAPVPEGLASASSQPAASAPATVMAETTPPPAPAAVVETASAPAPEAAALPPASTAVSSTAASGVPDRNAQAAAATSQDQAPLIRTNARAVVVDVVVTKGNGEPVLALGKQAFEVLEDGKPQPLDYFEEHTATESHDAAEEQLPPDMFTNTPAAPQSDSVNVVLIDNLNTPFQDQVRVHQQIADFLTKMQPGTRIAVFVLGSKLQLIQRFTSDASALRAALNDKKAGDSPEITPASRNRQDDTDDQEHVEIHAAQMGAPHSNLGGYGYAGGGGPGGGQAWIAANQGGERVLMTLEALKYLARYLAGIPGRKNLIWFSTSFPISVFPSAKEQQAHVGGHGYDQAIREAAGLLTLSKVAVYPVSAEGVPLDNGTEASSHNGASLSALYENADDRAQRIEALNRLAADTGGKAFYNTNDLAGAMAHAIDDGAHYYTLVYTPSNTHMDGSYRRIEVKLTEGKYDLAYRHGYFADDRVAPEPRQDSDPLHPLLLRNMPNSTQILLRVRVLPAAAQPEPDAKPAGGNTKLSGPLMRYRVNFSIRSTDVDLEPGPDGKYSGKIQLGLLAYDRDGNALNWAGGAMAINAGEETYAKIQQSGIPARLEIDLPNTEVYLEAGVFDWNSRKAGTLEIPIHPATKANPGGAAPEFQNQAIPGAGSSLPGAPQR